MRNRLSTLTADCCCYCVPEDSCFVLQTFVGGELRKATGLQFQHDSWVTSSAERPHTATWKGRWFVLAFPHGRAFLLENGYGRLTLALSFECPLNVSAVAFSPDSLDDSALVVFGTDEGPSASHIHVVRLTFSNETISVKVIDTYPALGGISTLASLDEQRMLVSYTVRKTVDLFNPSPVKVGDGTSSPSFKSGRGSHGDTLSDTPGKVRSSYIEESVIEAELPLQVFTMHDEVYTVAGNGLVTLHNKEEGAFSSVEQYNLGFEVLGIVPLTVPLRGILACGLRGELAIMDMSLQMVVQFHRSSSTMPQIDGFAISVSQDSRLLVLLTSIENPERVEVVDLGALCLGGVAPVLDPQLKRKDDDESTYEFRHKSESFNYEGTATRDVLSVKNALRDAWNLFETRTGAVDKAM